MKLRKSHLILWALSSALFWNPPLGFSEGGQTAGSVPMPSEQDDRGNSQNGASAMALAASALQQVMCLKLMAEATRENNSEKLAMASMMCAQAAASAANAAQNKEGAKKVTLNSPMASAPSFEKPNIDTQPKADNFDSGLNQLNDKRASNPENKKEATPIDISGNTDSESGSTLLESQKQLSSGSSLNVPDINPNPSSSIALKDPQANLSAMMGNVSPFGNLNGMNSQLPPMNLMKGQPASETTDNKLVRKPSAKGTEPTSGAQGGGFDDPMARFMNGAGAFGQMGVPSFGGGTIDLAFGLQTPGQRPKTIFEFASEQYTQIKTSGRAFQKPTYPKRFLASE